MKLSFGRPIEKDPAKVRGIDVKYGREKRAMPKIRWYLILCLVAFPLIFLTVIVIREFISISCKGYITSPTRSVFAFRDGLVDTVFCTTGSVIDSGTPLLLIPPVTKNETPVITHSAGAAIDSRFKAANAARVSCQWDEINLLKKRCEDILFLKNHGAATSPEYDNAQLRYFDAANQLKSIEQQIIRDTPHPPVVEVSKGVVPDSVYYAPCKGRILSVKFTKGGYVTKGEALITIQEFPETYSIVGLLHPADIKSAKTGKHARVIFPDHSQIGAQIGDISKIMEQTDVSQAGPFGMTYKFLEIQLIPRDSLSTNQRIVGIPVQIRFFKF